MDLGRIAVRAIVAYVYLLVSTRASGKRTVSQATPFDFVFSLILGDLIDDALWAEVEMAKFGAAAASVCLCDVMVKMAAFRWRRFDRVVDGVPRAVLRDGRPQREEMRREQLSDHDLEHMLRMEGIYRRDDVELGLLERDGELSVIYRPDAEPAQRRDAKGAQEQLG